MKKVIAHNRILVIKLGALGDFVQALGPMAAIRRKHKKASITLLTSTPFKNFAQESGYFDEVWIDSKPRWKEILKWLTLRKQLKKADFTRVYDLQNNDRTALYLWLCSFLPSPEWVGASFGASHRNDSPQRTAGHAFDGHKQTLSLAGIQDVEYDTLDWASADLSLFDLKKPYVLLVPGCSPRRPEKRWPTEKFGRLAKILKGLGYQPIILGTAKENKLARIIKKESPEALDLTGETELTQIAVMARDAAAAIGNDTGTMHLIAATGCPCQVIFSPFSDPLRHAPHGESVHIIESDNLEHVNPETLIQNFKPRQDPPKHSATRH